MQNVSRFARLPHIVRYSLSPGIPLGCHELQPQNRYKTFFNPYTARIKQCYVWVYSPGNRFGRQFRPTRAWKLRGSVLLEPIFVSLWKVSSVRFTRSRFSEKLLAGKLRDNTVIVCLALPIRNQFIPF